MNRRPRRHLCRMRTATRCNNLLGARPSYGARLPPSGNNVERNYTLRFDPDTQSVTDAGAKSCGGGDAAIGECGGRRRPSPNKAWAFVGEWQFSAVPPPGISDGLVRYRTFPDGLPAQTEKQIARQ